MKDGWQVVLAMSIVLGITLSIIIPVGMFMESDHQEKDVIIRLEGTVTYKEIRTDGGGFLSNTDYILTINNNTEYEVTRDNYNSVQVNDYIKIYETGRVEIIE